MRDREIKIGKEYDRVERRATFFEPTERKIAMRRRIEIVALKRLYQFDKYPRSRRMGAIIILEPNIGVAARVGDPRCSFDHEKEVR